LPVFTDIISIVKSVFYRARPGANPRLAFHYKEILKLDFIKKYISAAGRENEKQKQTNEGR